MCLVAIPLVDAATLFCLEVTAAEETKELFILCIIFKIIFNNFFKIWTIGRWVVLFRPIALIAFSRFSSKVIKCHPKCIASNNSKPKWFNNANILQIMFENVTRQKNAK